MKTFEITIWNTVNMSRDIDEVNPVLEQHNFNVEAESEKIDYVKAKELHYEKTHKGVWEHEICEA